jgi:hypothetical protein
MSTTPRLWKSLTQVNTADEPVVPGGTAYQSDGQVAGLLDGGYVVVWTDESRTHNPAGSAVVGQRYDIAGNKVGGEVKLSGFVDGYQFSPAVTRLPDGNVAVAFVDLFSGDNDIWVSIFTPALGLVRSDSIDSSSTSQADDPSITALAGGGYAVSYTLNNGVSDTDIVTRVVSPTGVVGAQFDVENGTDNSNFSQLATLSNGNFVVVYQDEVNGSSTDTDIKYAICAPGGGPPVIGPVTLNGGGGPGEETDPDVAALRSGGFVVAWTEPEGNATDIRATVYNNAGMAINENILVNTETVGVQIDATVVGLADGGFVVSWEESSSETHGQRFDTHGNKIGDVFTVGPASTYNSPEAALLTHGRVAYTVGDSSVDLDVMTSVWATNDWDAVTGPVSISAAGDFNSNGMRDYIWRDAGAAMTMWEYDATYQLVSQVDLGTVGFSWNILAGDHFSNASTDQMLTQNVADGTMTLWWTSSGPLTGVNIGQRWNGIDYIANGQFTNDGGAGIANFLVTNVGDHHLYNWWIDANYTLQGIDLGAVWSNVSLVGTGEFSPNGGTDFLVSNESDHHLYNWWIDPTSHTLQGYDLGAAWNNVTYIASGQFTANGGGYDNFLVFNESDHHLYNWWIDPASHTLQGIDLGAAWNNVELLAAGHFSDHTAGEQFLVRNTVDNHWYEWWIDPTSHTLQGIDLGARPGIEFIEAQYFNSANGSPSNDQFLVRNTADGDLYEWWISNNQLAGVDLII